MLKKLKEEVLHANLELVERGLVLQTFGNVSGIDQEAGAVVIKPSGVSYSSMRPEEMVVVSLKTGEVLEGDLRPSSDTPTHLVLYRAFPSIGAVVHTHSLYATAWAQANTEIPALGTTHADYCFGKVPCTRLLTDEEIATGYEAETGNAIVERLRGMEECHPPFILVASHAPFAWGKNVREAVDHAEVLEFLAKAATETMRINAEVGAMQDSLLEKHYRRKHGTAAYYGQVKRH